MACWGHQAAMCCRATGHVGCITHTRHDIGDAMKDTEGLCKTELCLHLSGSPWPTTTTGSNSTKTGTLGWNMKTSIGCNLQNHDYQKPLSTSPCISLPWVLSCCLQKKCCLLHVIAQAHRWSLTPGTPWKNGYQQISTRRLCNQKLLTIFFVPQQPPKKVKAFEF